jgi:hypothetical protein
VRHRAVFNTHKTVLHPVEMAESCSINSCHAISAFSPWHGKANVG